MNHTVITGRDQRDHGIYQKNCKAKEQRSVRLQGRRRARSMRPLDNEIRKAEDQVVRHRRDMIAGACPWYPCKEDAMLQALEIEMAPLPFMTPPGPRNCPACYFSSPDLKPQV